MTLAADRLATVVCRLENAGRAGPSQPSAQRDGFSPACRASGPFASALIAATSRTLLLEAIRAVHGLVATWLERNAGLFAAARAGRREHLALAAAVAATAATGVSATTTATTTAARATRGTAGRATGRRVLQPAALIELLLTSGPNELLATVATGQGLVCERHLGLLQMLCRSTSRSVRVTWRMTLARSCVRPWSFGASSASLV